MHFFTGVAGMSERQNTMQKLIAALVGALRENGVQPEAIAEIFDESAMPEDMLSDRGVFTAIDRILTDEEPVMLSRDRVSQLFSITPQGVSWNVKRGNLRAKRIRVGGRFRTAITLSSACHFFGVTPDSRDRLLSRFPRDKEGNIKPVFWDLEDDHKWPEDRWGASEKEMGE